MPFDAVNAFYRALATGNAARVRQLIEAGAPLNAPHPTRPRLGLPLQTALLHGHEEVVALLLEAGATPAQPAPGSLLGPTPFATLAGRWSARAVEEWVTRFPVLHAPLPLLEALQAATAHPSQGSPSTRSRDRQVRTVLWPRLQATAHRTPRALQAAPTQEALRSWGLQLSNARLVDELAAFLSAMGVFFTEETRHALCVQMVKEGQVELAAPWLKNRSERLAIAVRSNRPEAVEALLPHLTLTSPEWVRVMTSAVTDNALKVFESEWRRSPLTASERLTALEAAACAPGGGLLQSVPGLGAHTVAWARSLRHKRLLPVAVLSDLADTLLAKALHGVDEKRGVHTLTQVLDVLLKAGLPSSAIPRLRAGAEGAQGDARAVFLDWVQRTQAHHVATELAQELPRPARSPRRPRL